MTGPQPVVGLMDNLTEFDSGEAMKQGELITDAERMPPAAEKSNGLAVRQPSQLAPTPMDLLQMAIERGVDVEKLTGLMALQERYEANQARHSFNKAFAAFKEESVKIARNITVTDGPLKGKKYADLYSVVDAATHALSKHGLGSSWKVTRDEPQWIEVTCLLRHVDGHSESVSMGGPPDTGGAKNAIQARCSTKSYLERYTFLAITGLASMGQDDDATGLGSDWLGERVDWIKNCAPKDLQSTFRTAYKEAAEARDAKAMLALIDANDKRKKELAA